MRKNSTDAHLGISAVATLVSDVALCCHKIISIHGVHILRDEKIAVVDKRCSHSLRGHFCNVWRANLERVTVVNALMR